MHADLRLSSSQQKNPTSIQILHTPKKLINISPLVNFSVTSKFAYGKLENPLKLYRGEDCAELFCDYIVNEAKRLYQMFPVKLMKPLTREQRRKFNEATGCHMFQRIYAK